MRKLLLLAAMLAMALVVASPALAQQAQEQVGDESGAGDLNQAQCQNFAGQGAGNFQYQSTGDRTTVINQNCVANAGGEVNQINVEKGGTAAGGDFKAVGTTVFKGAEAPVFVSKTGEHFVWWKNQVAVVPKTTVTLFTAAKKDVAVAQYQYKAAAVQYQYQYQYAAPTAKTTLTVLPDTGGASLITLGAGVLLVAGGLLARRIVR